MGHLAASAQVIRIICEITCVTGENDVRCLLQTDTRKLYFELLVLILYNEQGAQQHNFLCRNFQITQTHLSLLSHSLRVWGETNQRPTSVLLLRPSKMLCVVCLFFCRCVFIRIMLITTRDEATTFRHEIEAQTDQDTTSPTNPTIYNLMFVARKSHRQTFR